jgi:hypothetical protein
MPDHFTETTTTGYGKRVGNAFGGIIVGIILFFASFVVLYTNEGAVDFSLIAKTAVQVDASQEVTDAALKDKLLSTTGTLTTTETIGDDMYLKPGKYIALVRDAEMYAWVEKKSEHSQTDVGGGETTTTTYDYVKEWTANPQTSSGFRYPEGHQNPSMEVKGTSRRVAKATIGVFDIDMQNVDLPSLSRLTLNAENTDPAAAPSVNAAAGSPAKLEGGEYIYMGKTAGSTFAAPAVGDVRISYSTLNDGVNVTIFGKLTGKTFGSYLDPNNNRLFRIFTGSREEAISSLHEEYVMSKWIWRGVGFLMMWIGLAALMGPISVILDFLPFLGGLSRNLIGAVTFVVALVLSAVTILISMVFHNVVALVVVLVVVVGGAVWFVMQKKAQAGGVKAPPIESAGSGPGAPIPPNPPSAAPKP